MDSPYVYPGTEVLRNKYGITNAAELDRVERRFASTRASSIPSGNFDLAHLQSIHKHLFEKVYDWAGEIRVEDISKAGYRFCWKEQIQAEMEKVHSALAQADFLKRLPRQKFAEEAARAIGGVNFIHPFREGNGRTQALYLAQLGKQAGHNIDLQRLGQGGHDWIEASRAAYRFDYGPMTKAIDQAITMSHGKKRDQGRGGI